MSGSSESRLEWAEEIWTRALKLVRSGEPDAALALVLKLAGPSPTTISYPEYLIRKAVAEGLLGRILVEIGRAEEAVGPLRRAIHLLERDVSWASGELAAARRALEEAQAATGRGAGSLFVPIAGERDLGVKGSSANWRTLEEGTRNATGSSAPSEGALEAKPGRRAFQLRLEGDHADRGQVVAGSDFDLVFAFEVPAEKVLAIVAGRQLEEARLADLSFDVVLTPPPEFVFRDGVFARRAVFSGGELRETLRFRLRAPAGASVEVERFWVSFSRRGRPFYQMPLELALVGELDFSRAFTPPHVDLDRLLEADLGDRQPRHAQLVLRRRGGTIRVACSLLADDPDEGVGSTLEVERFDALALENRIGVIKTDIENGFRNLGWTEAEDLLARSLLEVPGARENLEQLATAGYKLHAFLSEDPAMKRILEAVERLPPDSLLEVQTDNVYLPWEILNRHAYDAGWHPKIKAKRSFQPQDFWGYRFQIESKPLAEIEDRGGPPSGGSGPTFVSINLNPSIDEEPANIALAPGASHLPLELSLRRQGRCSLRREGLPILEELSLATEPVTFLYLFCHGRRENPFQLGGSEQLELEKGTTVTPGALDTGRLFTHQPIVMLNSCSSGAFSPLQFDSFLTVFKKRGACGLVATTFPVPTLFAAAFGRAVLEAYARGEQSIGEIVLGLRRHLLENGNPLGLLYTLQCPLEARAPPTRKSSTEERRMSPDKPVTVIISDTHIGGGEADPLEDHLWQGEPLVRLLGELGESAAGREGGVELIVNGDFLEFVQVVPEVFAPVSSKLWCSEQESRLKLAAILGGHPRIFEALRLFQEPGNRVTVMAGNHDVDLYWPHVQEDLRRVAGPLHFELGEEWYSRYGGRLQIAHGHQLDPANRFESWEYPVKSERGVPRLEICAGTRFVIGFVNALEKKYPFVDNIKPFSRLVKILLKEDVGGFSLAAWLLTRYLASNPGTWLAADGQERAQPHLSLQTDEDFASGLLPFYRRLHGEAATLAEMRSALAREAAFAEFLEELLVRGHGEGWPPLPGAAVLGSGSGTLALGKERMTDGVEGLRAAARERSAAGAQVIVCGHTHVPDEIRREAYVYFNTGSWTRYLMPGREEHLRLADLEDSLRYPYQLAYVRVTPGDGVRLAAEKVIFETG